MKSISSLLIILVVLLPLVAPQSVNPDHYYDLSKIESVNGREYVIDSVTGDLKTSFFNNPARTGVCDVTAALNANGNPYKGPEGFVLHKSNQGFRLENANNVALTSRFMIAVWVKTFAFVPPVAIERGDEPIFTQARYDNLNDSSPLLTLGVRANTSTGKVGMKIAMYLYNNTASTFTYVERVIAQNSELKDGWALLSLALDNVATPSLTKLYYRIRAQGQKDGIAEDLQLIYKPLSLEKQDQYIGSHCDLATKAATNNFRGTISRLYVWKALTTAPSSESQFDKYFFRNSLAQPICQFDLVPCSFCVVGFNPPLNFNSMPLQCTTYGKAANEVFLTSWDFNNDLTEYISDQSGNGFHLFKDPINDIEANEVMRINNQGYLFDQKYNVRAAYPLLLTNYPQFTVEAWVRRDMTGGFDVTDTEKDMGFVALRFKTFDNTTNKFYVAASDMSQKMYIQFDANTLQATTATNLLSTGDWTHLAWSVFKIKYDSKDVIIIQISVNGVVTRMQQNLATSFVIPPDAQMYIESHKAIIVNRVRIYGMALGPDELPAFVGQYNADPLLSTCTNLGTQAQCTYCPLETKICLSTCAQNTYGNNCDACHVMCGHCTGPTKNDCIYCSRQTAVTKVMYSTTYGNCTCVTGFYYNTTNVACQPCDSHCSECYGPTQSDCLTCTTGKAYFPSNICVDNCVDSLVIGDGSIGYYQGSDMVGGVAFPVCVKCHPYCKLCNGPNNGQCSQCHPGYFLKSGSYCYDICPGPYYADSGTATCADCDTSCTTCSGPTNTECLSCTNPALVQQSGTCQATCNNGFFKDNNNICQTCNIACATCTTQLDTTCGSCNSGYYLDWLGFSCKPTCKSGTYGDTSTNMCLLCHYSCKTCIGAGPDQCTQCATGYLKRGSLCVTSCADGEFVVNGTCATCDHKCSTCFGYNDNQCYSCAENIGTGLGYYYFNQSCITTCPDGYYPDNFDKVCRPCKSICSTCTSWDFCTSCIYGPYQLNNGECTYFTCLDTQYRAIRPTLACYDCHLSCKTCQGQSKFDCLSCKPQYQYVDQQCLTCKDQPGMTEPLDPGATGCVEICGDGFNYGFYQCDDGNMVNGDGCSSSCQIERGFGCSGGSSLTPDICIDNQNPTPKIALINSNNHIYVSFDEEVTLQDNLDENSLSIKIEGSQAPYKFEWLLNDESKVSGPVNTIIINMEIKSTLKGTEKVLLNFLTSKIYLDNAGNGILTVPLSGTLMPFEYIDPATKAKLDAAGDTSMMATLGGMAINLAISLVFGGSISAMWTMVNTIQLVSLLPLMSVNWPNIVVLVFEKMLSAHGESTAIPNIIYDSFLNRTGSDIRIEQAYNDQFKKYGWTVSNFAYLSGRKILMWTGMIVAYPFVWYMKKKFANKHKYCRLWNSAEQKFRYTMLLRGVIMSYASMYLASTLNIFMMDFSTMENVVSAFMAIAFQIILVYLPIHIMNILQRNYERVNHPKFMASYSTIIKEVDLSKPIRYMYYPVFLMRRVVFVLSLVLFANMPKVQIAVMSFTAIAMMIYVIVIKPQKEKMMIILTAAGEALLLVLHLITIAFLDESMNEDTLNKIGWFTIVLVGGYILVNWVVVVVITVINMKGQYRDWKKKKADQKKKLEEDYEYKKWKKKKQLDKKMHEQVERTQLLAQHQEKVNEFNAKKEMEELGQSSNLHGMNEFGQNPYDFNGQPFNFMLDLNINRGDLQSRQSNNPQGEKFRSSFMIHTQSDNRSRAPQDKDPNHTSVSFNYSSNSGPNDNNKPDPQEEELQVSEASVDIQPNQNADNNRLLLDHIDDDADQFDEDNSVSVVRKKNANQSEDQLQDE